MIYLKVHDIEQGKILAMCDSKLIDKVLSDSEIEINIRDYSDFYKGELVTADKARSAIKSDQIASANIIGEESIAVALGKEIINLENVKRVADVPYANMYTIQ